MAPREILVEYVVHGNAAKATAIDSVTGLEASVTGPAGARTALIEAARRKLDMLARKQNGGS
ncbi:MAG TPA: hypothetical protein VG889_06330 [Rhizomicrobium sp.]|nr:hypothetical protein [Rhizomicrobium sp.]